MNRFVSFFSSPPDKHINSNSHLTNSSSSEMIAATSRPRISRNNNNNQTRIGRSNGDRTAITPHSSRANYHPTYNSSQSDASDSEDEDIQHASAAPKRRRSDQRDLRYNHEDDDIPQHSDGEESLLKKPRRNPPSNNSNLTSQNHRESSPTVRDDRDREDLIATINQLKNKLKSAQDRIKEAERSLQVAKYGKTKRSRGKNDDATTRQYKSELRAYIKYDLGRKLKFLPTHWELWSDKERSVCQMVLKSIKFHPDATDEEKMTVWSNVLAPNMNILFSDYKNKIHQPMRLHYMSKCVMIFLFPSHKLIYFSIKFHITEQDDLIVFNGVFSDVTVKSWFDKTIDQVFNDERLLKNMITFLLNYALHAVPKDETYSSVKAGQLALYDDDILRRKSQMGFPVSLST
jgi:hypothetical protein